MNDIDRWFERTAGRRNRVPSLYASLLTGKIFSYLAYRLRYPLLLATAQFAVHAAEFFLILSSLGGMAAFTVMMLRVGSLIVGGAWWGLLEVMRERLRMFSRSGQREAAGYEIGSWLVLAVIMTVIVTIGGALALAVLHPSGHDPVAHLYAFLVVAELAINFPVRALHSGVYATRRVYRPRWSIFLSPVVQVGVISLGFYYYPAVAIIVAIIVSNAIAIAITVHYSLETYRVIGLHPRLRAPWYRFWRSLPKSLRCWVSRRRCRDSGYGWTPCWFSRSSASTGPPRDLSISPPPSRRGGMSMPSNSSIWCCRCSAARTTVPAFSTSTSFGYAVFRPCTSSDGCSSTICCG
jgi:hypothetical protein